MKEGIIWKELLKDLPKICMSAPFINSAERENYIINKLSDKYKISVNQQSKQ